MGIRCGLRVATYTTAGGGGTAAGEGPSSSAFGHASAIISVVVIPTMDGGIHGAGLGEILSFRETSSFQVPLRVAADGSYLHIKYPLDYLHRSVVGRGKHSEQIFM